MLSGIIQIGDCWLDEFHCEHVGDGSSGSQEFDIEYGCKVQANDSDPRLFRVSLHVNLGPSDDSDHPYVIRTITTGEFSVLPSVPDDLVPRRLMLSANVILYGFLRGFVSTTTGAFLPGRYTLPSLNVVEIVDQFLEEEPPKLSAAPKKKPRAKKKSSAKSSTKRKLAEKGTSH